MPPFDHLTVMAVVLCCFIRPITQSAPKHVRELPTLQPALIFPTDSFVRPGVWRTCSGCSPAGSQSIKQNTTLRWWIEKANGFDDNLRPCNTIYETSFLKRSITGDGNRQTEKAGKRFHGASAFNLCNSLLVMKGPDACGCSAFSQVQTFLP